MKTIIAGSRTATKRDVYDALALCRFSAAITEIVSGCARGADTYGEEIAAEASVPVKRFPADWEKHGKAAGAIRNQQMADYADALIAVWDSQSPGTRDMIERAKKRNLKLFVHQIKLA